MQAVDVGSARAHTVTFTTEGIAYYTAACYTMRLLLSFVSSTSSTAQGGGGSFKNRKPIGEIGCCESGMAERSH